jgi:DNA-binding NarL/FixJ family response regulator
MKVDEYMGLITGLNDRIEKSDGIPEVKDPGTLDKILCDICLQLLENSREIGKLSKKLEDDSPSLRDEMKMDKMISNMKVSQDKAAMTRREKDIVMQLIGGKTNREISEELHIDEKTVKNHLWKTYKKLGVKNRTQLLHRIFYE